MDDEDTSKSYYNIAWKYLEQMSNILYMAQSAALEQKESQWYNLLLAVYRQISVSTEEFDAEINPEFEKIAKLLADVENSQINKSLILGQLHTLDIRLRRIAQSKNMILSSKEDAAFAVFKR